LQACDDVWGPAASDTGDGTGLETEPGARGCESLTAVTVPHGTDALGAEVPGAEEQLDGSKADTRGQESEKLASVDEDKLEP
jgi:hypothetical protein